MNFFFLDYLIGEVYVERIIVKFYEILFKIEILIEVENNDLLVFFICDVVYNYFSLVKGCLLMLLFEDLLLIFF